ncbi:MAG: LON peptidase substrate-binding domain-containing protein, partial [Nitrospiraceae bacterium]|nr:LON peptidase substrate-binding domain-containing protein [Nitrospiraceae bacterium]
KPYRIARASWLQDVYRSGGEGDLASGVDRLRRLCGELVSQLPEPVPKFLEVLTQREAPGVFVDRVSSLVVREPEERQRLLELSDVPQRIAEVIAVLEALVGRTKRGSPQARARWN